ncbi:hypothetical protein ACYG9R_03000 [Mesorhizobium sp. RSR565B]|uniref:hypothetical protein n=1 Tax=Mesorhizobium sp. L103C565B0 TaxID=1287094 RepID=UPI0012DBEA06|nr:hypothetical protein [Mesorhizobium sp. L103C565B0]
MFSHDWTPAIALVGLLLAIIQWVISLGKAKRERDSDLTGWGSDVIDLMAELETHCDPIVKDGTLDRAAVERLSFQASALVDKGRLFFPNVKDSPQSDGIRTKILDEVLRACYAARYLSAHGVTNNRALREQVWAMRKRFVELLQQEMRPSLRKVGKDHIGQHVEMEPALWVKHRRKLVLAGDANGPKLTTPATEGMKG